MYRARRENNPWDFAGSTAVGDSDLRNAFRFPLEGWHSYDTMMPMGNPAHTVDHAIFALGLRGMPPPKTSARKEKDDPLFAALQAPGAKWYPLGIFA